MSKWFSDKMKRLTIFVLFALSYHNLIEHKHPERGFLFFIEAHVEEEERKTFILILKFCQGEKINNSKEKHTISMLKSF